MKLLLSFSLCLLLLYFPLCGNAQAITNSQSLEIRAGKTFSVGDYASLRYRHTTSTSLDLSLAAFINVLQKKGFNYSGYGLDLLAEYYTAVGDNTNHQFECKLGFGATASLDNEPWVFRDLPLAKRLNYGICGEVTGEWCMSENISLCLFAQQKYLFNKLLGNYAFSVGLGLKLNLD
jgi:hypothetical protein